ncbi:MAG TPA: hypothetical protein VJ654_07605 [Noviherbaspirillum sp.]|nr:hypothetical protein [Noviherbaspirillum sp.]
MSDYRHYSTYVPTEADETPYRTPAIRDVGGSSSVVIRDGVATYSESGVSSIRADQLSAYADDDWRSTAIKQNGFRTNEIKAETLVTLNGQQARVQDFVSAGLLQETPNGFELASTDDAGVDENQANPLDHPDAAAHPAEIAQTIDKALEPFDDMTLDSGLALGIASVSGEVDFESVVMNVARKSGMEPKDAEQRIQFTMDAYQAQTDKYVSKNGIAPEDLQDFYAYCRENGKELKAVLQQQMYQRDMSAWKGLISKYQKNTAPSLKVLQENGFETRTLGNEAEVRINGVWMTVPSAARNGLI